MYDAATTARDIADAEAIFKSAIVPHTVDEIDEWTDRLKDVYDPDTGNQLRKLDKEEHAFILNEGRLCRLDFRYASTHYYRIRDKAGVVRRFAPNVAQRIVTDIWAELEAGGHAIKMQQLKARQLGVSTLSELAVCHRGQFHPDVNAVVASSSPDQSEKMAAMIGLCLAEQPWWIRPIQTRDKAGTMIGFGGQNSFISIQAGNQMTGIARGTTPDVVHLSELADYPDPEALVDASLMRAIHEAPWIFVILESTAKGRHNWWHNTWKLNSEQYAGGQASQFRPLFLPWFVGRDIYPTDTWIHTRPIPDGWVPHELTTLHAERAKHYVRRDPLLRRYLGTDWEMALEQQWYYEFERDAARAKKELNQFLSEMPADPNEAFQSTNISAFDTDTILIYREAAKEPWGVFGIRGEQNDIPMRLWPSEREIDRTLAPIPITCEWGTGHVKFDFIPLKWEGYANAGRGHGKFLIYDPPEDDFLYGLGCDTGDGVGEDGSVLQLVRKGTSEHNDRQVAEFASPYINAYNLWPMALSLATLYKVRHGAERKQPKAVIECKGNGEAVQLEMRKRGWSNFHHWMRYDGKKMRLKDANKIGWFTNQWSRAQMMDLLMSSLNDGWLEISSPFFVDEMADLERSDFGQSLKAMYGGHDDRIMALGMVLFSLHVMETRGGGKIERKQKYDEEDYPTYSPGAQGSSIIGGDIAVYTKMFGTRR